MVIIQVLLMFVPSLIMMCVMWINCSCLDSLPKHAFSHMRHHVRWALVFLILTIGQLAFATYMSIQMIDEQYHQAMEHGE